ELLAAIGRLDIRVIWVAWILRTIVWSMRALLDTAFTGVVLVQRALGREMEFQADLVSVSVTGSDALINALHRLVAADDALEQAFSVAARERAHGRMVPDLYALQSLVTARMAEVLDDPEHGKAPPVPGSNPHQHRVFEQEIAQAPRMWSTHPSNHDREQNA